MIVLKEILDHKEIIDKYSVIEQIPFVDTTSSLVLSNVLQNRLGIFFGYDDDKFCGLLIFKNNYPELFILGLHAVNQVNKFLASFVIMLKEKNFTSIKAVSAHNKAAYEKVTGFKQLWATYGRQI